MRVLQVVCLLLSAAQLSAQSVGIGTNTPQASALLEVNSNNKGFLPPRMTFQQIKAIPNPSPGLLVYDSEFRCLRVFDGVSWVALQSTDKNLNDPPGDFAALNYGDGNITPLAVRLDQQGNIIVCGYFSAQITVDGITLNSAGLDDIFLFKFTSSGHLSWYKTFGGTLNDQGAGVALDASGNIYLTGGFQSTSLTVGASVLTNVQSGTFDLFLAKIDPSGTVLWANAAGGNGDELMLDVVVDASGNCFIGGFSGSDLWVFGPNLIFGTLGDRSILLAKYNSAGVVQWARTGNGTGEERAQRLAVDASGNCYLTGFFTSATLGFGGSVIAVNSGAKDMYLAKYDAGGNALWVKSGNGNGNDWGYALTVDPSGNVIVGGIFSGTSLVFQGTTLTNTTNSNADAFIIKCDPSGNALWVRSFKGNLQDYLYSVTTDASGSIYVGGFTTSTAMDLNGTSVSLLGANSDAYFARLDANGQGVWARIGGGNFDDAVYSVAVNADGSRICAVGEYVPKAKFGSRLLTSGTLLLWLYGE